MATRKEQQRESTEQVTFALPVNALDSMSSPIATHFSNSHTSLGELQELTPAVLGRSDLFPCTKKRSWGNTFIVRVAPEQA